MKILIKNQWLTLSPGDRLVRTKGGVFSKHHGLYLGNGTVAENQVGVGVRYASFEEFIGPGELVKVEPFQGTRSTWQMVLNRVNALIGREYRLASYNCEHFVNHALTGNPKSPQIAVANGVIASVAGAGVIAAAAGKPKVALALLLIGALGAAIVHSK